jgi:F420-dependent methylenetetrahydromethanopterin dehydrogenase
MRRLIAAALLALPGIAAADAAPTAVVAVQAQEAAAPGPEDAGEPEAEALASLDELLWIARPLVVFADSPNDPRYGQQMALLEEGMGELEERLVVVLTDTDPAANGPLRRELRPRGFGIVLIDTDGLVVQRRPAPTTVRELSGTIDRLPSRRQETGSRRQ